ncbi:MAG: ABC-F family ATP-binding cassette domain-containing protein [Lachnospiraceae bacterium]|nr:ABC-F family ATP-binding cassette domain-containing protein [Lachnospiraceae bacterium]
MNIITLENIHKVFTERQVFDGASFYLEEGEKVGVVGINGTGKSTLLKIIAGLEEADDGKRILANHLVVEYLAQHTNFAPEEDMLSCISEGLSGEEKVNKETQAKAMLTGLGITEFSQKVGTLSGGQQKRLALTKILLSDADVLLLDEPTNHLDQRMTSWLEETLKRSKKTIIMVTHDRYFLDSVCNRIVEVDKGKIYSYAENYSGFLQLKAEREDMERAADRKRKSLLRTELAWVQRGARARSTKQKFRLNRYEELKNVKDAETDGTVELGSIATRMGKTTIEIENLTKGFDGKNYIKDFTYFFRKQDRIGIVGGNGCGKTTLMKLIAGKLEPDAGSVKIGQTIKIGYYSQKIEDADAKMDPQQKIIDYIRDAADYVQTSEGPVSASAMLERFLFIKSAQYNLLGKLSGGEKRRLNLLRVLMEAPNVLILDEPTNDLDITTLTVLEDFLDSFEGIVIVVSHDRYFLDRTVSRIFAFMEDGTLRQFEGGYTDYELQMEEEGLLHPVMPVSQGKSVEEKKKAQEDWKKQSAANKKLKFTFQEQKDYEVIEDEIAALEEKLRCLEADMVKYGRDFGKLNDLTKEKEATEKLLEEKMDRWMYLEDLAERIKNQ